MGFTASLHMWRLLLVSTLFQLIWLAAIQWRDEAELAILFAVMAICLVDRHNIRGRIFFSVLSAGLIVDSCNIRFGVLIFPSSGIPMWMFALWIAFAWYANYLLPLVSRYPAGIVAMGGGIAGGLTYYAGFRMGAVESTCVPVILFMVMFFEWVLLSTMLLKVTRNKNTHQP